MGVTRQVLIIQSDQLLDTPTVENKIVLRDIPANRALNLVWSEPAGSDRTVNFPDPGADDAVAYLNATQTLTNKTLGSGTVLPDQTQYVHLAGQAGGQFVNGGTAASENLTLASTSNVTKGFVQVADPLLIAPGKNVTLQGAANLIMGTGNITLSGGGEVTGLPATPSGGTAATSKTYVDAQIALAVTGGISWRETILTALQLDNTHDAIAQAVAFFFTAFPGTGDTFHIKDGATTETYTVVIGLPGAFQYNAGVTPAAAMANLNASINTNSVKWSSSLITNLQSINSSTGNVLIIWKKIPDLANLDRIYGTFAVPTIAKYVNYGGLPDYRSSTNVTLPAVDPAAANFGFARITSGLSPVEAHLTRSEDSAYVWNDDLGIWQLSAGAVSIATSGSGGGVIGQATFDSDLGLSVTAGVARVKVDGTTVDFNISGQLEALPQPTATTGLISQNVGFTLDIPAVTAPTPGTISTDIPTLDYPNGSTTGQLFDITIPDDYDSGNLEILAVYQMSTAFVGNVKYQTQAKIVHTSGSIDTATYPATLATLTPPVTAIPTRSLLFTILNGDFSSGDVIQIYISRIGADVGDTHTGVWQVASFEYRYLGQVATRNAVQVLEVFSDIIGETSTTSGTIGTDIPTVDFLTGADSAQKAFFIVPDNWDGFSDAQIRFDYAMSTAVVGGVVRIRTSGKIVNVLTNTITSIPTVDFDLVPSNDTNPHRTVAVRSINAASLSKGSYIELAVKRIVGVGSNHSGSWQVTNGTVMFGLAPVGGFVQAMISECYLNEPSFGNIIGPATVSGDSNYPTFGVGANDFETLYVLQSTSAGAGEIDAAFEGRLASFQTKVDSVKIACRTLSGSPSLTIEIRFEGQIAAVYTNTLSPPSGTLTSYTIDTSAFTQPTGSKRFYVIAKGVFSAISSLGVSTPFVSLE